jgi:hypothetical protein
MRAAAKTWGVSKSPAARWIACGRDHAERSVSGGTAVHQHDRASPHQRTRSAKRAYSRKSMRAGV